MDQKERELAAVKRQLQQLQQKNADEKEEYERRLRELQVLKKEKMKQTDLIAEYKEEDIKLQVGKQKRREEKKKEI